MVERKGQPGEPPLEAARAFCRTMCDQPRLPAKPLYGSNNWYYAYGRNTSAEASLKDAALMAELMPATPENRPFVVIDMGWGAARDGAGPVAATSKRYPDMAALARGMKDLGVRPGIWMRPTLHDRQNQPRVWRLPPAGGRPGGELIAIDPSIPEALAYIAEKRRPGSRLGLRTDQARLLHLRPHRPLGFRNGPGPHRQRAGTSTIAPRPPRRSSWTSTGPSRGRRRRRPARLQHHRAPGGGPGGGAAHRRRHQRQEWSRTRKMGVNTLAFRMAQHNTFFAADADCVPITRAIPWSLTKQWLDLVARSGTALFLSADPAAVDAEQKPALKAALAAAAATHQPGVAAGLDGHDHAGALAPGRQGCEIRLVHGRVNRAREQAAPECRRIRWSGNLPSSRLLVVDRRHVNSVRPARRAVSPPPWPSGAEARVQRVQEVYLGRLDSQLAQKRRHLAPVIGLVLQQVNHHAP